MKKLLLILLCLPMIGFGQDKSPCLDERYIELKKIDLDSMSDREYQYFLKKEEQCKRHTPTKFGKENRIKQGSIIKITNSEKITSKDKSGDTKKFIVYEDFLSSSGLLLVNRGTELIGRISKVKKPMVFGIRGTVSLEINYVNDISGDPIRVSSIFERKGKSLIALYLLVGWIPPWVIQPFIVRGTNAKIYEGEIFDVEVQEDHFVEIDPSKQIYKTKEVIAAERAAFDAERKIKQFKYEGP